MALKWLAERIQRKQAPKHLGLPVFANVKVGHCDVAEETFPQKVKYDARGGMAWDVPDFLQILRFVLFMNKWLILPVPSVS